MRRHRFSPAKPRSGFALLITITLLAFLVLLLVSLASLTRVETQVASNNQQLSQARQNALMAMNLALGRLQQLAGPDQRITGTAELVSGVHDSKRRWTGVWNPVGVAANTKPVPTWLVSTPTPAESLTEAVVKTAMPTTAVVTLVGDGSTDGTTATNIVKVQTQPITADTVTGFSGPQIVGNFAYWVGDEGVKAKASLTDPWESPSAATLSATSSNAINAANFRFSGLQRTGAEGFGKNAADARLGTSYPATDAAFKSHLAGVFSPAQLPLANTASATDLSSTIKSRYHDLTTTSFSLMTNVADGGLKRDLTAWLAKPDGASNLPRDSDYIANASTYMPRWSQIRSYAAIVADGTAKAPILQDAEALPTTPAGTPSASPKQGIYPVITYARMGYNVSCAGQGSPMAFHMFPVVTLWNPHNVPIAAHDYEMRYDDQDYFNSIVIGKESEAEAEPVAHTLQRRASYNKWKGAYSEAFATAYLAYSLFAPANLTVSTKLPIRFRLRMTEPLLPGQSLVFTLKDPGAGPADAYSARNNIMEAYAPNQSDNSVVLYGPTMTAADLAERYFMCNTGGQSNFTLRDYADPTIIYHYIQAPTSASPFFNSTPTNTSFLVQSPTAIAQPMLYIRTGLYQSQGQNGPIANPAGWFAVNSRWLALFNPLAPHALRLGGGKTTSFSYYMDMQGITNPGPSFGSGNRASIGPGEDVSIPASDLVVHEFLKPGVPLFSLAQLQHVNMSQMNLYPAYAVGNSLASVYVKRDQSLYTIGSGPAGSPTAVPQQLPFRNLTEIYDLSYVLNRTLWDKYFFSTVPASLTAPTQLTADYRLPNSRHLFYWKDGTSMPPAAEFAELKATDTASAHLLINGGFNVNSTSVQAWRALLYSRNGIVTDPSDAANYKHAFSRYSDSNSGVSNSTPWTGFRVLSNTQLDNLAVKIVEQVKLRGPFLSLSDFVNRRLVAAPDATGLNGPLQAAINAVDADASITATNRINSRAPFTDAADRISTLTTAKAAIPVAADTDVIRSHWIGDDSDANNDKPSTSRAAFAPGFLSQADLLTSIGPVLTARSDTFTIRAYGDVQNPATANVEGRAWCEAIVQRVPEYADTSLAVTAIPAGGSFNEKFGRRFRIVSFRWLAPNEI